MKFVFLTANEDLDSGLLQSQLVEPVEKYYGDNATLINIHRPFGVRFDSKYLSTLNFPFLIPFRFINFGKVFFLNELLCLFYALVVAFRVLTGVRKSIFVARGYVPGLIAWWLNRMFGIAYVFDPRSLYIHEHVGARNIKKNSLLQRYWLWVEKRVVETASQIICVSKGMVDYYSKLADPYAKLPTVLVPCFAESKKQLSKEESLEMRADLGFLSDDLIVGYYGSLNAGWNNIDMYQCFFDFLEKKGVKVLIISQDAELLRNSSIGQNSHVKIVGGRSLKEQEMAQKVLGCVDYGLVLMREVPDWETRLSVKFAEYTCQGLPVIVGEYVGEAVRLVIEYNLEPSVVAYTGGSLELRRASADERSLIQGWALKYFHPKNINRYKIR